MIEILAAALASNRRPSDIQPCNLRKNDLLRFLTGMAVLLVVFGGLTLTTTQAEPAARIAATTR